MPDPCPSPHQKAAGFARSPHMDSFTKEHVFAILVSAPVAMLVWQKARKSEIFQEKLSPSHLNQPQYTNDFHLHFMFISSAVRQYTTDLQTTPTYFDPTDFCLRMHPAFTTKNFIMQQHP